MTSNMTVLNFLDTHMDEEPRPLRLLNQTPETPIAKNYSKRPCTILSSLEEGQERKANIIAKTIRETIQSSIKKLIPSILETLRQEIKASKELKK